VFAKEKDWEHAVPATGRKKWLSYRKKRLCRLAPRAGGGEKARVLSLYIRKEKRKKKKKGERRNVSSISEVKTKEGHYLLPVKMK